MSRLCNGRLTPCRGLCFPMPCPATGRKEVEFRAEKCDVGPTATLLLCVTVSWILPGCSGTDGCIVAGAASVRKEQQKAVVEEQPALRAAAGCRAGSKTRASTPAMATSSSSGQHKVWLWGGREPVQPAASPEGHREAGGMEGVFVPAKMLFPLQNSGWRFPTPEGACRVTDNSCPPMQRAQEGWWRAQTQGNIGQTRRIHSSY